MGLRYRDLVIDVLLAPPVPGPCGCTATANAPKCPKGSQNPNQVPNCNKGSARRPPKKALGGLEALRQQLRDELRTSG